MAGFLKALFGRKEESVPAGFVAPAAASTSEAEPIHVTDDTFEELVLNASSPALVDFWAPWCGPCRMIAPIMQDLAKAYDGRAVVAKMNTDENAKTAVELGIMGIPTLVLFKDGQEVDRVLGFAARHTLEEKLNAVLN